MREIRLQAKSVNVVTRVTRFPSLAKAIWTNAKFGGIKDIPGLEQFDYHFNVRPITARYCLGF